MFSCICQSIFMHEIYSVARYSSSGNQCIWYDNEQIIPDTIRYRCRCFAMLYNMAHQNGQKPSAILVAAHSSRFVPPVRHDITVRHIVIKFRLQQRLLCWWKWNFNDADCVIQSRHPTCCLWPPHLSGSEAVMSLHECARGR